MGIKEFLEYCAKWRKTKGHYDRMIWSFDKPIYFELYEQDKLGHLVVVERWLLNESKKELIQCD